QLLDGRQEIVGHGAADAAIGQLDDILVAAGRDAAAGDDLAINAEIAELVDHDREAPGATVLQQMPKQAGLAGTEKTGDDRGGNTFAQLMPPRDTPPGLKGCDTLRRWQVSWLAGRRISPAFPCQARWHV